MGTVFLARDPELERQVALKVLKLEQADARAEARLSREAQAMATLNHPNVLPVYDVAWTQVGLCVAMEYVDGVTLREWMSDRSRPWTEVVGVLVKAGRGLAAAHDAGLVHRDFKPSNVLVSDDGRVRVADFGLARVIGKGTAEVSGGSSSGAESVSLTQTGSVMGTPQYMAPEQHQGETPDTFADQYSFCVTLWEALYGERPFTGLRGRDLVRRKHRGPPKRPSSPAVPGWVHRALVRGLAPGPDDRWPTMGALLVALEQPRRGRVMQAAGVTLALGALAWVAWPGADVDPACRGNAERMDGQWNADRAAAVTAALGSTGRAGADDAARRVVESLDGYGERWREIHAAVCDTEADVTDLDLRLACLQRGVAALAGVAEVLETADGAIVTRAISLAQSLPDPAPCGNADAMAHQARIPTDPALGRRVADVRDELARIKALKGAGRLKEAQAKIEVAVRHALATEFAPVVAEAAFMEGVVHGELGDDERATARLSEAYFSARELGNATLASDCATELVAIVYGAHHDYDEAARWAEHAFAAFALSPSPGSEAWVYNNLGLVQWEEGRTQEALRTLERSLELRREARGEQSVDVGVSLVNLSLVMEDLGQHAESLEAVEEAAEIFEKELGIHHPYYGIALGNVAAQNLTIGDPTRSMSLYMRAYAIETEIYGEGSLEQAHVMSNIGVAHREFEHFPEALQWGRRALEIRERLLPDDHRDLALSLRNIGEVYEELGDGEASVPYFERSLAIYERALGAEHGEVAQAYTNLGNGLMSAGRETEAIAALERAIEIYVATIGPNRFETGWGHECLGLALLDVDRPADAREHLARAVMIYERPDVPDQQLGNARFGLARAVLRTQGDRGQAIALAEAAREAYEADARPFSGPSKALEAWLRDPQ